METALYIEVLGTCIFLIAFLIYKMVVFEGLGGNKTYYVYVLMNALLMCLLDVIWQAMYQDVAHYPLMVNRITNALYLFQGGHLGFSWSLFSAKTLGINRISWRKRVLLGLPLFVLFALCFASLWRNVLFYVSSDGSYHRGAYFVVQPIVSYGYLVFASIQALYTGRRSKNYMIRLECRVLASFVLLPFAMGVAQLFFEKIPLLSVGMTLAFLLVYMQLQEHQIALDPLTGLNNRFRFQKYLERKMGTIRAGYRLYLMIFDVDAFKLINDTYGHVEGDDALRLVADALRRACTEKGCFLARFGGDEFTVLMECKKEQSVVDLQQRIIDSLDLLRVEAGKEYYLTLSCGYSCYSKKIESSRQFIEQADEKLYEKKQRKKIAAQ